MNKFDESNLDGATLRLFLTVLEEGSVTEAAVRLGLTQSAVSYALKRLNALVSEPLFVRAGRGIAATDHALELADLAQRILDDLHRFAAPAHFDPARTDWTVTIAANDLQRELLLPALYRLAAAQMRRFELHVISSRSPGPELLRERRCDLIITPLPPDGTDMRQKRLLTDRYVCFYDPAAREAPRTRDDYLNARHATVVYTDGIRLRFDQLLFQAGIRRDIVVTMPNFSALAAFLRGSDLIATLPSLLSGTVLRGCATTPIPLAGRTVRAIGELPLYMVWHQRSQSDPVHTWLRGLIEDVAQDAPIQGDGGAAPHPRSSVQSPGPKPGRPGSEN